MRYVFFITAALAGFGVLVVLGGEDEFSTSEIIGSIWTIGLLIRGGIVEARLAETREAAARMALYFRMYQDGVENARGDKP